MNAIVIAEIKEDNMSKIIYLGDMHARINKLESMDEHLDGLDDVEVVQVGDLGYGFPDGALVKWLKERAKRDSPKKMYTCFGNHDNWDTIYKMWNKQGNPDQIELYPGSNCYYVHRNSIVEIQGIKHLFFGGAESTDQGHRKAGRDWWAKENPSLNECEEFVKLFEEEKPDTIVSHDAPLRVELFRVRRNYSLVPNVLERAYIESKHKPRRHYFGHHHTLEKWKIRGTKFYCCGLHGEFHIREF